MSEQKYSGSKTDFYIASPEVVNVVNLAVDLNRPLLVEGEPGCGKTMLAHSIAVEKGLPLTKISVKSTTRAQDLLYRMNVLRRLQDAQDPKNQSAQHIHPYLSLGLLGEAIHSKRRCVVLIDEVDKADIDFPNDLLDVLDKFEFQIEDLPVDENELCLQKRGFGRTIAGRKGSYPIVIITSNREKRLPEPFLRRCLYVRLKFPETAKELGEIVRKNLDESLGKVDEKLKTAAVEAFQKVRETALGNTQKPPSTSELIDWVRILHWTGETVDSIKAKRYLPPHWQLLFKTMGDLDSYETIAKATQQTSSKD